MTRPMSHARPADLTRRQSASAGLAPTILALTLCLAVATTTGCLRLRDGLARSIGAPSSDRLNEAERRLTTARDQMRSIETEVQVLGDERRRRQEVLAELDDATDAARARLAELRLEADATADPARRAALVEEIEALGVAMRQAEARSDSLRQELDRLADADAVLRRDAATTAARADAAERELGVLAAATEAAAARSGELVRRVGGTATALGVPGAAPAAGEIAALVQWLIGMVLAGGVTAAPLVVAQRRAKREAASQAERAEALSEVITVNERLGFESVATDPRQRRRARALLSPTARVHFDAVKSAATSP